MAQKKPSFHNQMLGAGGGGGRPVFSGAQGGKTAGQAQAARSGQSVAKNYRASGQAGGSVAKPKTDYKGGAKSVLRILGF